MRQRPAAAIALIRQLNGRLQYSAARAIYVELAAREPAEVSRICRVEQQQRRLAVLRAEVQQDPAALILKLELESRLPRDILQRFGVQFQQHELMPACLQNLHRLPIVPDGWISPGMMKEMRRILNQGTAHAGTGLVLFDIDGTLLRRAGPHHREALVEAVRRATGLQTTTEGIPVQGMLDRDILAAMLVAAGASRALIRRKMPEMVAIAQAVYVRRCPDLRRKVCPGARMLLYRLSRRGVPAGLVTGNLTRIGWKKMERAGLQQYLCFGAFAERARDRAGLVRLAIRHACGQGWIHRTSPVVLIGDHPNDIRAARANGVRAIAVATGMVSADDLARHAPDMVVPDMRSLSVETLFG